MSFLSAFLAEPESNFVEVENFPTTRGACPQASLPRVDTHLRKTTKTETAPKLGCILASITRQWIEELKALISAETDTPAVSHSSSQLGLVDLLPADGGKDCSLTLDDQCDCRESPSPTDDLQHGCTALATRQPLYSLCGASRRLSRHGTPRADPLFHFRSDASLSETLTSLDGPLASRVASLHTSFHSAAHLTASDSTDQASSASLRQGPVETPASYQPVVLLRAPCYRAVVSPLLIVFDLDNTILRTRLSDVALADVCPVGGDDRTRTSAAAEYYIDAEFFLWFCEQATRTGHLLAIASLTEGAADSRKYGASAAETVLYMLDCVLPRDRTYLCSVEDIACQPQTQRAPGKQSHLQGLQQRLNAAWQQSLAAMRCTAESGGDSSDSDGAADQDGDDDGSGTMDGPLAFFTESRDGCPRLALSASDPHSEDVDGPLSLRHSSQSCGESAALITSRANGNSSPDHFGSMRNSFLHPSTTYRSWETSRTRKLKEHLLPSWLSTDVLLIDDNATNCIVADRAGYRAACCAESGFTREWFAHQSELHELLGVSASI